MKNLILVLFLALVSCTQTEKPLVNSEFTISEKPTEIEFIGLDGELFTSKIRYLTSEDTLPHLDDMILYIMEFKTTITVSKYMVSKNKLNFKPYYFGAYDTNKKIMYWAYTDSKIPSLGTRRVEDWEGEIFEKLNSKVYNIRIPLN